jgi:DNA N-6-adenine-methyltransferase (Dam)
MLNDSMMRSVKQDWCTPPRVLERVRRVDAIALDPCTSPANPCGAEASYSLHGLSLPWWGLAYVNPPYGRELPVWADKVIEEAARNVEIIMLVPSRTDTRWWGKAFEACQACAFWRGRITFVGAPAPAPFPSCLFYFGTRRRRFSLAFRDVSRIVSGGRVLGRPAPSLPNDRQIPLPFSEAS